MARRPPLRNSMLPAASDREAPSAGQAFPPDRLLRLAELALKARDLGRLQASLDRLEGNVRLLADTQLVSFLRLAERARQPGLMASIIREVLGRPVLAPPLALSILQLAHNSGDAASADSLEGLLAGRIAEGHREDYLASAARMRRGPDAALALRRRAVARRNAAEAAKLAADLLAAGHCHVARRYLRRCHRRWPLAPRIRSQFLESCLKSGYLDEARTWVSALEHSEGAPETEALRLSLAFASGKMDEAREILTTQIAEGRRRLGDTTLLRTLIALGDLNGAEKAARAIKTDLGQADRNAAHFGIKHPGNLLNELKLHLRLEAAAGASARDPATVAGHFFAAKDVLSTWCKARPWQPGLPRDSSIPRRIIQYWNEASVPTSVREVMRSWDSVPGWDYLRLDRRGAISWLRDTFGRDHARAFRLANHVAEESDFLRLCLLAALGGIYADADDKLMTSPEDLAGLGPGLILFVELDMGAIQNNLICAPKGHPVLVTAVELALAALLRRDNDSTWSKTGPGLLTRSAALHVVTNPTAAERDLTLVPRPYLQRYVNIHVPLPYKSTPRYWNAKTAPLDPVVRSALNGAEPDARAQAGRPDITGGRREPVRPGPDLVPLHSGQSAEGVARPGIPEDKSWSSVRETEFTVVSKV